MVYKWIWTDFTLLSLINMAKMNKWTCVTILCTKQRWSTVYRP